MEHRKTLAGFCARWAREMFDKSWHLWCTHVARPPAADRRIEPLEARLLLSASVQHPSALLHTPVTSRPSAHAAPHAQLELVGERLLTDSRGRTLATLELLAEEDLAEIEQLQRQQSGDPMPIASANPSAFSIHPLKIEGIDEADLPAGPALPPGPVDIKPAEIIGSSAAGSWIGTTTIPLSETFNLNSRPGASKTIYLDFDGHTTTGTIWNSAHTGGRAIVSARQDMDGSLASWSNTELAQIQKIWQRVAEDYLPFDVNVTTRDPGVEALRKSGTNDNAWGVRVVVSTTNWYGAGGVSYVGSFNWNTDTPVFVFYSIANDKVAAEAISHEVGHALGLNHDRTTSSEYYYGHGSGATSWAPIMGVGYNQNVTQWSRGDYPNATNHEDDLAILTSRNGFGYRPDDHGNTPATASTLSVVSGSIFAEGIIERTSDVDVFRFTTSGGSVQLNIRPALLGANLDVQAKLLDGSGRVLVTSNPAGRLDAAISANLAAGTYYVSVEGTGDGSTYNDYGSLGYYSISGSIAGNTTSNPATSLPVLNVQAIDATAGEPSDNGTFRISCSGSTDRSLSVNFSISGSATRGADYRLKVGGNIINGNTLTLPAGQASVDVIVEVINDTEVESQETITLQLTSGSGYALGSSLRASVNLTSDDLVQPSSGAIYLSDLNWASATAGWGGSPRKDRTIEGNTIMLNGISYAKGIGTHANSTIVYNLGGQYTRFISDIGVGRNGGSAGSVTFEVWLDNVKVYDSGRMTSTTAPKRVDLNVSGKNQLKLVVTDAGNGNSHDHADWADARLIRATTPTTPSNPTPPTNPTTPSNPTTPTNPSNPTTPTSPSASTVPASTVAPVVVSNGLGPIERNMSNGGPALGDGQQMSLDGVRYSSGLGVHAPSNVTFYLGGQYSRFLSDIGVDDSAGNGGSVVFQVYADGVKIYDSGRMTGSSSRKSIDVNVSGRKVLWLIVTDGGDGNARDYADWANARFVKA